MAENAKGLDVGWQCACSKTRCRGMHDIDQRPEISRLSSLSAPTKPRAFPRHVQEERKCDAYTEI